MSEPARLAVVPVEKYDTPTVVRELRRIADELEAEPDPRKRPGKFLLIVLQDWECEGSPDSYNFGTKSSRMRSSERIALLEAAKYTALQQLCD